MAGELQLPYTVTGKTAYAIIRDANAQAARVDTHVFEAYQTAQRANYLVNLAEQGAASAFYVGDFPTWIQRGLYGITYYIRKAGSPAENDTLAGAEARDWSGTNLSFLPPLPANFAALGITVGGHISNVDTLTTYTGNTPQTGNVYGALPSNFSALAISGIGHIATVDSLLVNADKFGYTLTQAFPPNFGLLGITSDGHIANVDTLVTYAGNTPQSGDVYAHLPANFWQLGITSGGHISNVDTLTTYTGNTPQTGDVFAALPGHFSALGITPGGHVTNVDALSSGALSAVDVPALTGVPGPTASLAEAIGWVYVLARNTRVQTATVETVYADDDTTPIATSTKADTGSVFTRGKYT